jgi:glycosyltransferase involved in cell wall biosynthesis
MKILSFDLRCLDLTIGELHYTGGERQFYEITKNWAKLGHEIHIIGSEYTKYLANIFDSGVIVHTYHPLRPPPKRIVDLLNIYKMVKKLPKITFDFIYCPYEVFEWVFASVLLKNKLKIPLVTSVNLFEQKEVSCFPLYVLRYKLFFRNLFLKESDIVFCVSEYIKKLLQDLGVPENRLYVFGSGVNLDVINSVSVSEKTYDACFMGDLIPRKGILDLIFVWKEVTKELKDGKLVVIGKGDEKYLRKIESVVNKLNLQHNVFFAGFVPEEEKYRILKSSKIFIFPSRSEGSPIAVCEAMACGLPVVAYNLPGLMERYGNGVFYSEIGDIKGMARHALTLLKNDKLRSYESSKSMERAVKYNWENIAKEEINLIAKMLRLAR